MSADTCSFLDTYEPRMQSNKVTRGIEMAFINEFISKENIKRHGLDRVYFDNHPGHTELPDTFRPDWTIDGETQAVLRKVGGANTAREAAHWIEFRLDMGGKAFFVKLNRGKGSASYKEAPYVIVWDSIVEIDPATFDDVSSTEMIACLKDALTAYGDCGVHSFVHDVVVKFNF